MWPAWFSQNSECVWEPHTHTHNRKRLITPLPPNSPPSCQVCMCMFACVCACPPPPPPIPFVPSLTVHWIEFSTGGTPAAYHYAKINLFCQHLFNNLGVTPYSNSVDYTWYVSHSHMRQDGTSVSPRLPWFLEMVKWYKKEEDRNEVFIYSFCLSVVVPRVWLLWHLWQDPAI